MERYLVEFKAKDNKEDYCFILAESPLGAKKWVEDYIHVGVVRVSLIHINDESNKEVKIEITQEKNESAVVLKVTSVDGLISISNEQIAKMTDYDKKHVISVTEHLSVNKEYGTDFSTFEEAIKYEYDNGIISENSEEFFWNYVESHGGLDIWLKGTLEYCFENENGVYNLYEIINPEGEKSGTYTATQSGSYTFTVKDLLDKKEYKKIVDVTVEK